MRVYVCPKIDFTEEREQRQQRRARLTREQVVEGLQMYVDERLTGMELARRLNISTTYVGDLLKGRHWKDVPRPEGFQYPWPDARLRPHRDVHGEWLRLAPGETPPVYTADRRKTESSCPSSST